MRCLLFAIVLVVGCRKDSKPTVDRCQITGDCRGAQVCWCDRGESSRCLDGDDLPAGICVSREERRQRECIAEGKPTSCRDEAETGVRASDRVQRVAEIEGVSLGVKVSEPRKPPPSRGPNAGNEDGKETLELGHIYQTYSKYGGQLGACLASTGEGKANVYISIDGPSGRVTSVSINGKQNGALYDCLNRVLRGMKFPAINGARTRAEFEIEL